MDKEDNHHTTLYVEEFSLKIMSATDKTQIMNLNTKNDEAEYEKTPSSPDNTKKIVTTFRLLNLVHTLVHTNLNFNVNSAKRIVNLKNKAKGEEHLFIGNKMM